MLSPASDRSDASDPPVAIVGVGALFPGSTTTQGFWGDIVSGRECVTDIPATHWRIEDYFDPDPAAADKIYSRRGAFLSPIEFSPLHFGIPPASLPAIDSVQLLALEVAERLLADMAGKAFASVDRERIAVILGVASTTELVTEMAGRLQAPRWRQILRDAGLAEPDVQRIAESAMERYVPWQENTFPGLLGNVVAGRIANRFDLGGTNYVIDAACGSSLAAVASAVSELNLRRADLVITGGVDALGDVLMFKCFSLISALSKSGACRPFSADADGTLIGEGLGLFALKRLADAERDGDHVYAVIRGIGSASDGRALSIYAPRAEGQAKAVTRAYARAGYGPEEVELVEAHGTGTRAGDLAEVEGLRKVFERAPRAGTGWCALGSVKSQIGHTKAAAGSAGLFKVAMALHHRILPPTINVDRPDPRLSLDESPFYLNTRARPWIKAPGTPRRASVSSFGFGGTNFHVTLEEYDGPAPRPPRFRNVPGELLLLSAADREGLTNACREYARRLAAPDAALDAVAHEMHETFSATSEQRLAIVAADATEGARELERTAAALAKGSAIEKPGVFYGSGDPAGKIAFVFPGQGSQYVGMGADLAMHFEIARTIWDRAAAVLEDVDFLRAVFPPPSFDAETADAQERALRATERAQPAIATAGFAATAFLGRLGLTPELVAGHSLGEITALAAAGAFDFETLVATATERGRAMADATSGRPGAMTAVLASRERVEEILGAHGGGVVIANQNGPAQTVISGEYTSIEDIEAALAAGGIDYRRLAVAAAFHSPLLGDAAASLERFLGGRRLHAPALPVYSHVTAASYASDVAALPAQVGRAIVSPVRFTEQVEALYRDGARVFIEPGPDNVLTRLIAECLKDRRHLAVAFDKRGVHGVTSLWRALGALAAAGVSLDLAPLWEGRLLSSRPMRRADPTTVRISGTNFGKRYPMPAGEPVKMADRPRVTPVPVAQPPISVAPPPTSVAPPPTSVAQRPTSVAQGFSPAILARHATDRSGDAWIEAFSEIQRQTASAHADFQRLLAERHAAFLKATSEGLRQLAALAGVAPSDASVLADATPVVETAPFDGLSSRDMAVAEIATPAMRVEAPPVAASVPAAPAVSEPPSRSRSDVLLDIVAEKTGYPREALELTMDLESDLGIDSIKRVEILAAAHQQLPDLPRLQADKLAGMRTLAQIAAYFDSAAAGERAGLKAGPYVPEAGERADLKVGPYVRVEEPAGPETGDDVRRGRPSGRPDHDPRAVTPLERSVITLDDAPAPGFAVTDLRDEEPLSIVGDGDGLGHALAARLSHDGIAARVVETLSPSARRIIMLGSRSADSVEAALAINRRMLTIVASRAGVWERDGGLLVSVEQDDHADAEGAAIWLGGLSALCRTARVELPRLTTKIITLRGAFPAHDAIARTIQGELVSGGTEPEIHLTADGRRRIPRPEARASLRGDLPLGPRDVVLVSGGARGITAEALVALAQRLELRFVLLGRTPIVSEPDAFRGVTDTAELSRLVLQQARARGEQAAPSDVRGIVAGILAAREVTATLDRLRAAGSEARYVNADVADGRAVADVAARARREWGLIAGVIHGAGALADAWLRDKTESHVDRVFAPKLRGLANLLAATSDDPLRLICAFSSVTAHVGNAGQADYAMANGILERVMAAEAARRGPSCLVRALAWGPWDSGMVTPHLREKFAQQGVALIATDEGCAAFVRELESRGGETTVVLTSA